jgi:peptidylprolyl isomerase
VLAVAGCAGDSGGAPTPTDAETLPSDAATTTDGACGQPGDELPAVDTDPGDAPELTWPESCAPADLDVAVIDEGDGREVGDGAVVVANYAGYVWGSDTPFDSSFERGAPTGFSLNQVVAGWTQGIPGNLVGSRILMSIPPDLGYGPQGGNANAGIGAEDTIVFVIEIVETYNADDTGQADATPVDSSDLPVTISGDLGQPATLEVVDGAPEPTEPELVPVADGDGAAVEIGQSIAIAYSLVAWDGSSTETSWPVEAADGAAVGPMTAQVVDGSAFGLLAGVPIGSRVVLLLPASQNGPALAVLVDVLGVA